jgi:regulatory LuxR family protein
VSPRTCNETKPQGGGRSQLTPRQRQCLELRANHLSAKQIARELEISPHTVAMHSRLGRAKLRAQQTCASRPLRDQQSGSDLVKTIVLCVEFAATLGLLLAALLTLLGLGALLTLLLFPNIGDQDAHADACGRLSKSCRPFSRDLQPPPREDRERLRVD